MLYKFSVLKYNMTIARTKLTWKAAKHNERGYEDENKKIITGNDGSADHPGAGSRLRQQRT